MAKISIASNDNCIARAISTMRLALGYEKALPLGFPMGSQDLSPYFVTQLKTYFPEHQVLVREVKDKTCWTAEEVDKQLFAFIYKTGGRTSHMVIGLPVMKSRKVLLTFGVSLEKVGG